MGLLLYTMVIYAFWSFVLIQKGGMLSVAGMLLFAANIMLAYHAGRAALLSQRWIGIPHPLCGFGMIIAAIASVGAFNLTIIWVWRFCCL